MASASTAKRRSTWDLHDSPPDHSPAKQRANLLFARSKSRTPVPASKTCFVTTPKTPASCPPLFQNPTAAVTSTSSSIYGGAGMRVPESVSRSRKRLFEVVEDDVEDEDCRMLSNMSLDDEVVDLTAPKNSKVRVENIPATTIYDNQLKVEDSVLFTEAQMEAFVSRMVREHEARLKESFEAITGEKLAEHREKYNTFISDNIQRRFQALPSPDYMS